MRKCNSHLQYYKITLSFSTRLQEIYMHAKNIKPSVKREIANPELLTTPAAVKFARTYFQRHIKYWNFIIFIHFFSVKIIFNKKKSNHNQLSLHKKKFLKSTYFPAHHLLF